MMTFKDLKKLVELPSYKEQRVPTVKALEVSGVPVVAEKILENHGSIEVQDFNAVLKAYVGRKDKDLNKLMKYAKLFRVDKIIRNYMEVLL